MNDDCCCIGIVRRCIYCELWCWMPMNILNIFWLFVESVLSRMIAARKENCKLHTEFHYCDMARYAGHSNLPHFQNDYESLCYTMYLVRHDRISLQWITINSREMDSGSATSMAKQSRTFHTNTIYCRMHSIWIAIDCYDLLSIFAQQGGKRLASSSSNVRHMLRLSPLKQNICSVITQFLVLFCLFVSRSLARSLLLRMS